MIAQEPLTAVTDGAALAAPTSGLVRLSDVHLKADALRDSLVFPGPARIPADLVNEAGMLLERCKVFKKPDYMVSLNGCFFRGRIESQAVDGTWHILRQIPPVAPTLETLESPLQPMLRDMLLSPALRSGGMIYICGAGGSGKTSTASGTVASRLNAFGGVATTIENPPEMPLNGWHGDGYCRQTWVAGDGEDDWAESFRSVLRSQPAASPAILYVGEVRDRESALALLRAASNGFLVIATGFGTDLVSGLDALSRLIGPDSLPALSALLRLVIHQTLRDMGGRKMLVTNSLAFANASSIAAVKIRSGQLMQLKTDIEMQATQMRNGRNPLNEK